MTSGNAPTFASIMFLTGVGIPILAALNGGLNLSVLDGWWDEWYDGENGWAIPTADGVEDVDRRDDLEAAALYDLIENEVAPRFYDVDASGVPTRWLEMVRHTLKSLGPKVLATRMVRDYVRQLYAPAAATARALNSDYAGAVDLAAWKKRVLEAWPGVRVEHVESSGVGDSPEVGALMSTRAFVALGSLSPEDVEVQLVQSCSPPTPSSVWWPCRRASRRARAAPRPSGARSRSGPRPRPGRPRRA